jgi:hypothetical protein
VDICRSVDDLVSDTPVIRWFPVVFIEILENDKRQTISKEYALNLYRGAKVAKLLLFAAVTWFLVLATVTSAGDSETLTTLKGKQYEKVRVTEVTATIAFIHSAGVCRIPIAEFPPETRKRFGYDEAKAAAWIAEQTRQAAVVTESKRKTDAQNRIEAEKNYQSVLLQAQIFSGVVYDAATGRWYLSAEEAQAAREQALRNAMLMRYESGRGPIPQASPASPPGAK